MARRRDETVHNVCVCVYAIRLLYIYRNDDRGTEGFAKHATALRQTLVFPDDFC